MVCELDIAYPEEMVYVDCRGFRFHSLPSALSRDDVRANGIVAAGWLHLALDEVQLTERSPRFLRQLRVLLLDRQGFAQEGRTRASRAPWAPCLTPKVLRAGGRVRGGVGWVGAARRCRCGLRRTGCPGVLASGRSERAFGEGWVRVVGVDPGLSRCGVGVVEGPAHRPRAVRAGVIRTAPDAPTARRLAVLHRELAQVISTARPDAVAVERVFLRSNMSTGIGVAQAAGVALLCAEQAGVTVVEYTPTQVKSAVAGSGSADKAQVGYMVAAAFGLTEALHPPDVADALALALCHLQRARDPRLAGQAGR